MEVVVTLAAMAVLIWAGVKFGDGLHWKKARDEWYSPVSRMTLEPVPPRVRRGAVVKGWISTEEI